MTPTSSLCNQTYMCMYMQEQAYPIPIHTHMNTHTNTHTMTYNIMNFKKSLKKKGQIELLQNN